MIVLSLLMGIICGYITMLIAERKGRNPLLWCVLGVFFGIFAIIAIVLLPPAVSRSGGQDEGVIEIKATRVEPEPRVPVEGWYALMSDRNQIGPMSLHRLKEMFVAGELTKESYVWHETMKEWSEIGNMVELLKILEATQ
jgi:hypothetical protein